MRLSFAFGRSLILCVLCELIAASGLAQTAQPSKAQGAGKAAMPSASAQKSRRPHAKRPIPPGMTLDQDIKFKDYEVWTYKASTAGGHAAFEVLKGGKRVYEHSDREAEKYRVGCINEDDDGNAMVAPGKDITGQGKPNLVVSMWTGGAHCCFSYSVLELGDEVRQIGEIHAGHSDVCRFHPEPDGRVDFIVGDWTSAYWHASFAESPAPDVILRYEPGGYKVAADLMRKSAPSEEEFKQLVGKGRHLKLDQDGWPESGFWGTMLDLIYSGHSDLAWKFCDLAWPGDKSKKAEFLKEFRVQLAQSRYYPALRDSDSH